MSENVAQVRVTGRHIADVPRICKGCGKPFMAWRANVKAGGGNYCCRGCHNKTSVVLAREKLKTLAHLPPEEKHRLILKRRAARQRVHVALRTGKIVKSATCHRCMAPATCAHHTDYSKPLHVYWLCNKCHGFIGALDRFLLKGRVA